MVTVTIKIRFSVWLANGYAHVSVLVSVVIVALPLNTLLQRALHIGTGQRVARTTCP